MLGSAEKRSFRDEPSNSRTLRIVTGYVESLTKQRAAVILPNGGGPGVRACLEE
jgi:hypothetical protein